jgi:hypothetical protein
MSTPSHWKKNCCNPVNNFLVLGPAFGHGTQLRETMQSAVNPHSPTMKRVHLFRVTETTYIALDILAQCASGVLPININGLSEQRTASHANSAPLCRGSSCMLASLCTWQKDLGHTKLWILPAQQARKMADYLYTKDHMEALGRPIHSPVKMLPD